MDNETNNQPFDDMLKEILTDSSEEIIDIEVPMTQIDDETLIINEVPYLIAINYHEGFKFDEFKRLYQEYFDKYDYIVGDWAHERLRLRGFYQLNYRKTSKDRTIDFLDEYLKEYCNFGCAYFVVGKQASVEKFPEVFEKYEQKLSQPIPKDDFQKISTRNRKSTSNNRRRPQKHYGQTVKNESENKQKNDNFKMKKKSSDTKSERKTSHNRQNNNDQNKKKFVIKKKENV